MAQKRPRSENGQLPATENNTARDSSSHKDPLSAKHKKVERKHSEQVKGNKVGICYCWCILQPVGAVWFSLETFP